MTNIFNRLKELIYRKPEEKYLTPEEAKAVADQVQKSLINMRSHCSWAQVEVDTAVQMARTFPKGHPRHMHYRRMLKLRLVMQQYMEQMNMAMESISSQIELAQLSSEMGSALKGATQLVSTYKRDMPSFTGFVRDFMKTIAPMNEALNGGLDEMTEALDQLCGCTLDGIYDEADLDALIAGDVPTITPNIPEQPVAPVQAAAAAAQEVDDLLASIERSMPAFTPENHA